MSESGRDHRDFSGVLKHVGKLRVNQVPARKAPTKNDDWDFEGGVAYAMPPLDPESEKDSLARHAAIARDAYEKYGVTPAIERAALAEMEKLYHKARWSIPDGWCSRGYIAEVVDRVLLHQKDKSPGYPLMLQAATNEGLREKNLVPYIIDEVERFFNCVRDGEKIPINPIRIFIKREPHKLSKLEERRYRLIWSFGIVEQIIDCILWGPSAEAEQAHLWHVPLKNGLNFIHGGPHQLYNSLESKKKTWLECDKKGWDWTVHVDYARLEVEHKRRLCLNPDVGSAPLFFRCMHARAWAHQTTPVMTSDGNVYERLCPMIQPSGAFKTLSFNGWCQVFLKVCYCLARYGSYDRVRGQIISTGDDTLENMDGYDVEAYLEFVRLLGHVPEAAGALDFPHKLSFCSQRWVRSDQGLLVFVPTNEDKHEWCMAYNAEGPISDEVKMEKARSYALMYAYHPKFEKFYSCYRRRCMKIGEAPVSRISLREKHHMKA